MPPKTKAKTPRTAAKRATGPKVPVERKDQGYTRIPVTNVWASEDDLPKVAVQKYDWIGIGDAAIEGAKAKPDEWLLVSESAPSSVASNITDGRIKTLLGARFIGWRFRGRVTDMERDPVTGKYGRGRVWIKASRSAVDV